MLAPDEIKRLLPYLTPAERQEVESILSQDPALWRPLPGPQSMAYHSKARIIGFGGAAGGGKTDLAVGLALTRHTRVLIARREKAQTEGIVQRLTEVLNSTDGYNSQKAAWRIGSTLIEFAGLDNAGDERRWQGRPHDLKVFDEVTEQREAQVRFIMGWLRAADTTAEMRVLMTFNPPTTAEGRWVIGFFGPWLDKGHPLYPTPPGELRWAAMLPDGRGGSKDVWLSSPEPFVMVDGEPCYTFDEGEYTPEQIITPLSRTFIPSRVTDNPYYMATGYMSTLQALPEPLRSQMLYGDFQAGIEDDMWQVIPSAWVDAAMARWKPMDKVPEMLTVGVDVARGGRDQTVIARKHEGLWFDKPLAFPGASTPDGPTVAGQVISAIRNRAPVNIDVIGVGSSPYDFLRQGNQDVHGVNSSSVATATDRTGLLTFSNMRSQMIWQFREMLDPQHNTGVALPPDDILKADLCAFTWRPQGRTVYVSSREEVVAAIGRSPDYATAYFLAALDTPRLKDVPGQDANSRKRGYNPMDFYKRGR